MRQPGCGVLVVALLAAVGCAGQRVERGGRPAAPLANTFYPLAVGNRWVYQTSFLGQDREATVEILRQEDGYFVDNTGARLTADAYGVRDQKRYLLREPIETGRTWTNVVSVSSVEHYRIVEAGPTCEVPAGRFEGCVRVEGRNRVDDKVTLVNELTFAPGVGITHIRVFVQTPDGKRIPQTELKLREYHLSGNGQGR